jgi:DNA-binding response OmpR family regulator
MEKIIILAVDDNVVNLMTLEQDLQEKYEVITVNSGSRALRCLRDRKVDLVLLDYQMPDMDGIETLKEIRLLPNCATIPVIFLTANSDKFTVMEGMKLGIMDYIVKPVQSKDLHERIERTLKRRGTIPIEGKELYHRLTEILGDIQAGRLPQALVKAQEISSYRVDEDVSQRMKVIRARLGSGDTQSAEQMVQRVIRLLEARGQINSPAGRQPLTRMELRMRLQDIVEALDNFHNKQAEELLDELLGYNMTDNNRHICELALQRLREYDDAEAERLILELLS